MRFYAKYSSKVEIISNNKLQTYYFPRYPHCRFKSSEAKDEFNDHVDKSTAKTKCQGLVREAEWIEFVLKTEFMLAHDIPVISLLIRHIHIFVKIMLALIFVINILLTIGLTDGNMSNVIDRDIIINPLDAEQSKLLVKTLGYFLTPVFFLVSFKEIVLVSSEKIARQRIFVEKTKRKAEDKFGFSIFKIGYVFKIWYYIKNYFIIELLMLRVSYHVFLL